MLKRKPISYLLSAAFALGAATAYAQGAPAAGSSTPARTQSSADSASTASSTPNKSVSKIDSDLMKKIAVANLAEIETGKLVQEKSKNDEVLNFAKKMVDDHTKAQEELQRLSDAKGVTLPTKPDRKHQTMMKKLSSLSGAAFDSAYMARGGIGDHRETHKLLQTAQTKVTDPDVKALAAKMSPAVDEHLKLAEQINANRKGGSERASGASVSPASNTSGNK